VKQSVGLAQEPSEVQEPWFARDPRIALAVAVLMYAGVFVLRQSVDDPSEVITAIYVLPIALLAVTYGSRGGIIGSAVGVVLLVVWVVTKDVDLSVFEWITRIVPLLAMGLLLGRAWDRLGAAAEQRRRHEVAALRHRQAVEINDSLIQGMAAAKWAIEAGHVDSGLDTLDETIRLGQQLVSGLIRDSEMGPTHRAALPD
jgi:glucose-6-phosphate-specific signal transduction histidine kinase